MAFENHPASFGIVATGPVGADDDSPPATWVHDSLAFALTPDGEGWTVLGSGGPLGRLELVPAEAAERQWRVSDPDHETLGVGASWSDWRDALLALVDYRSGSSA